ncbi:MAG: DNA primase noncatalytic subunit PriX [Candidatus Aenigmatarchaeota archaeon]
MNICINKDNIEKQIDSFRELLLKEDSEILAQEYENQTWQYLKDIKNPIRRTICDNEIVFDIDAKDWSSCYKLAYNLENVLNAWKIPFLRYTSGNWLHYHVYLDRLSTCPNEVWRHYFVLKMKKENKKEIIVSMDDLKEFLRKIRYALFEFIVSLLPETENASIDKTIMKASRHMIRFEGSKNEKTGYYKSLLEELPKEKPQIREENIKLPNKFEYYKPDDRLLFYVYKKFIVEKEFVIEKNKTRKKNKEKYKWVEKILSNTFKDGRKRLIDLVILPYLINIKGLTEEESIKKCYDWAIKNHAVEPIRINKRIANENTLKNYIKYKARYVLRKKLIPLSNGFEEWFNGCEDILKVINSENT